MKKTLKSASQIKFIDLKNCGQFPGFCTILLEATSPFQLDLTNSKDEIAEVGARSSDHKAKHCVAVIKKAPDGGIQIILRNRSRRPSTEGEGAVRTRPAVLHLRPRLLPLGRPAAGKLLYGAKPNLREASSPKKAVIVRADSGLEKIRKIRRSPL